MMRKPARFGLMLLVLFCAMLLPAAASAGKGVDRGKIKAQQPVYPAALTIGGMSFRGQVSRMDKLTDEEIGKIIKDALKDAGMTELEVTEAQDTVDRVAGEEELTREDVDRVMNNLMKLAGVDNIADLVKAAGSAGAEAFADSLEAYAADEAREKALAWLLEQSAEGAGEAAGPITKLLDLLVISADQYARDQQKWKDRVDAANAQRELNAFYDRLRELMDNAASARARGWSLQIEDSASRNFTFFGIENNLETWTVNMILKKPDAGENVSASGRYTGIVSIVVEYEMSAFDQGFKDWSVYKSGFHDAYMASMPGHKVTLEPSDDYQKTHIRRNLDAADYSLSLSVPLGPGSVRSAVDFGGFEDVREIAIDHTVTVNVKVTGMFKISGAYTFRYKTENEEKLISMETVNVTVTGGGQSRKQNTQDGPRTIAWDAAIWAQWEKEKWLEISYPGAL